LESKHTHTVTQIYLDAVLGETVKIKLDYRNYKDEFNFLQ